MDHETIETSQNPEQGTIPEQPRTRKDFKHFVMGETVEQLVEDGEHFEKLFSAYFAEPEKRRPAPAKVDFEAAESEGQKRKHLRRKTGTRCPVLTLHDQT